jgi:hypothetical protein
MDDDEKDGVKRAEASRQSKKSIEEVLKRVARPAWRSPLFWWLIEHHDALRQNEAETGRGAPWRELCVDFVELGITLADGRPVKPATAKRTWQRVRKEVVRVEERRARERAEREARRAADPRRNMPSRFTGSFPAPLADRQPPRVDVRPLPLSPKPVAEVGSGLTVMPGGPVLTGGPEERLPAEQFTIIFEGKPFDLRLMIRPDDPRPWNQPDFSEEDKIRVMIVNLKMRLESWRQDRGSNIRVDREWRKRVGNS